MTTTVEQLNYDFYKQSYESYSKKMRALVKALIKNCPKEIFIEVLKENKIITRDWEANGERYGIYKKD